MTSTVMVELMLELEDALEVQIDVEEIEPADLASIRALADFVAGHMVEADRAALRMADYDSAVRYRCLEAFANVV